MPVVRKCKNCGTRIPLKTDVCPSCGTKIVPVTNSKIEPGATLPDNESSGGTNGGYSNNFLIQSLLGVIVLLLVVFVVVLLLRGNGNDSPQVADNKAKEESAQTSQQPASLPGQGTSQNAPNNNSQARTYDPAVPGIYPQVSTRVITYDEIKGMSAWDIIVMRNEVYARYGYIFRQSWELKEYFNSQSWYVPRYNDVSNMLTPLEKHNVEFLRIHTPKFDMDNIRGSNTYVR